MIGCILHSGSGAGDQLMRYITVRTLAEEKGFDFGVVNPENFKCKSFMNLCLPEFERYTMPDNWIERVIQYDGVDCRSYDPEINFVEDNTIIDGSFEDDKYWGHNLTNINGWLQVEPLEVPDDLCIIGFRGGEYALFPDLFLTKDYYDEAITLMREKNPAMCFQVHTDDPTLARQFFPDFEVVANEQISHSQHSNMGFNWRSTRFAKYAIIPNSAFFIMPRILRHNDSGAFTIAPRYWSRRNTKVWARPACFYKSFFYI